MRVVVILLVVALVAPTVAAAPPPTPVGPADVAPDGRPRIVAVYPNPILDGDRGEFVVVDRPSGPAVATLSLTDGETVVELPASQSGRFVVATEPAARNITDLPVILVAGPLRLANRGEWVALRSGDLELDNVTYPRAPEGSVYRRTPTG